MSRPVLRYGLTSVLRHEGFAPPGLACQAVGDDGSGNAANLGWHELQHTRSRHAEQAGEVVRNHEVGTCSKRGSELPKGVTLDSSRRRRRMQVRSKLVNPGGGRATVMSAAGHERTNPMRGEPGESRVQRSEGALKKGPGS